MKRGGDLMTGLLERIRKHPARETLTEAYEVRAFRDESEQEGIIETLPGIPDAPHAEPGALQAAKGRVMGHGEQRVLPDDCQFGDNDLCNVEV
jgi:hypothetical protein